MNSINEQDRLFAGSSEPKAHARSTDPDTSHQAAASVGSITEKQTAVLACIRAAGGPIHDADMVKLYRVLAENGRHGGVPMPEQSESGLRTRRSELDKLGLVRAADKVTMPTGRKAIRWRATTP